MTRDISEIELREAQRAGHHAHNLPSLTGRGMIWWLWRRALPDGRVLYLTPHGRGLLYLQVSRDSASQVFTDTWCYDVPDLAWRAVLGWDGEGEPEGWFRHPQSGRRVASGGPSGLDTGLRYWTDRAVQGGGGATPPGEFTCPTCGCFIGQRIENGVAVTRCQQCAPEPVPDDAVERTLLSLQSRWAHAECSREQVASEALAVIRQLTLDACAERARLTTQVAALSALAETILRPPPEVAQVYDLQNRLAPHTAELDRVLGQEDRCLLNWLLGGMHWMHLRIQQLESGQAADDLLRELGRQNDRQAARIAELDRQTMCWHCHDALAPAEPPHCEQCPGFERCDAPACPEPGCAERTGQEE